MSTTQLPASRFGPVRTPAWTLRKGREVVGAARSARRGTVAGPCAAVVPILLACGGLGPGTPPEAARPPFVDADVPLTRVPAPRSP